jgi:putative transposase
LGRPRAPSSGGPSEIKQRDVQDILICCVDGLKGFPEAIEPIFPQTVVQTCMVRYADSLVMPTWPEESLQIP